MPAFRVRGSTPARLRGAAPARLRDLFGFNTGNIDGGGTLVATGHPVVLGTGSLVGGGALTAHSVRKITGVPHLVGGGVFASNALPLLHNGTVVLNGGGVLLSDAIVITNTVPTVDQFNVVVGQNTTLNRYSDAIASGVKPLTSTGGSTNRGDPAPEALELV